MADQRVAGRSAGGGLTRRQVITGGGLAAIGAAIAACSSGSTSTGGVSAPAPGAASPGPTRTAIPASGPVAATSTSGAATSTSFSRSGAGSAAPIGTLDDATKAMLDKAFEAGVKATGVAGVAAFLWMGDQQWSRVAGVNDLTSGAAFDPSGHVRIASITKSYTGTAVLQLVDAGKVGLDDPIEKYVSGVPNGAKISVFDLLGMRSGLFDFTADPTFGEQFDADPTMAWSDDKTLAIVAANPLAFAPGEKVVYADTNYALLGMLIERVTGQRVGDYLTDHVIARLALPGTSYPTATTIPDPHPTGYVPRVTDGGPFDNAGHPPAVVDELNPVIPGAAGAMISTAADLRVWAHELTDGTLLAPATQQARLQAVKRLDGQRVNLGYGLGLMALNEFVGHDGAIFGFSSVALRRAQTDATLVLVANESTNSTTPTLSMAVGLIATLYPDQVT